MLNYAEKPSYSWYNKTIREDSRGYRKTNQIHQPHDKGYKYLLSNKQNFIELLDSFVKEEWVKQINKEQLTRIDKSFIQSDFTEREADLIYRLELEGREVLFYVLLELQSSVDYQMPYRLLLYMTEMWRETVAEAGSKARNQSYRLPVIIPIVLYSGTKPWKASRHFKDMLDKNERFNQGVLDFEYILIDVNRYEQQELYESGKFMASAMLIEQTEETSELLTRLKQLDETITEWENERIQMFLTWVGHVITRGVPSTLQAEIMRVINKTNSKGVSQVIKEVEGVWKKDQDKWVLEGELKGEKNVARRMLQQGMSTDDIEKVTQLSKEEIENLEK